MWELHKLRHLSQMMDCWEWWFTTEQKSQEIGELICGKYFLKIVLSRWRYLWRLQCPWKSLELFFLTRSSSEITHCCTIYDICVYVHAFDHTLVVPGVFLTRDRDLPIRLVDPCHVSKQTWKNASRVVHSKFWILVSSLCGTQWIIKNYYFNFNYD